MKTITYTLKNGDYTSGKFYHDLHHFTNDVLNKTNIRFSFETDNFRSFLAENGYEKLRTKEEYFFELLMIGVFWIQYSDAAVKLGSSAQKLLQYLVELRDKNKKLKIYVDYLRGILSTIIIYKNLQPEGYPAEASFKNFILLINWLSATGEFKEEVKRFLLWKEYFSSSGELHTAAAINDTIKLAQWFKSISEQALGRYTHNVESFLKSEFKNHLWKEDIIFCARGRVEYHMNMFGSEIMNRAFKEDFFNAGKRAVLLPACMRALPDKLCKAKRFGLDYICTGCTPGCRVHQLNMLGEKDNFKVYIIPHSSDFSQWLRERGVNSGVGTVGVACINNLISGGLELKSLDIPAQCVLLDYCGCKNHWDKEGIPTDLNINQLKTIMNKEVNVETTIC
ncbi:MAG: DUF116 domain-containing protein [Ignavibacteriaceae bacterium]